MNIELQNILTVRARKFFALVVSIVVFALWLIENDRQKEVYYRVVDAQTQSISQLINNYKSQLLANENARQGVFDMVGASTQATHIYLAPINSEDNVYAWRSNISDEQSKLLKRRNFELDSYFYYLDDDWDYLIIEVPVVLQSAEGIDCTAYYQLYVRYPNTLPNGFYNSSNLTDVFMMLLILLPWVVIFINRDSKSVDTFENLQNQLDKLHKRMESTQRMSKVGSWDFDIATEKLVWSKEVFDIFGVDYDPSNTGAAKFFDAIHPDDLKMLNEVFEKSLQSDSGQYEVEHRIVNYKTGKVHYLHERCVHVADESGTFTHSIGMVQDITERHIAKQALIEQQQELNLIMDIMVDGIITIDEKGIVLSLNASAEKLFGYDANEIIGNNITCLMPEKYAAHHDRYLRNYINTGEQKIINIGREVEGLRSDGKTFLMHLTVAELPQKPNQLRRFIGSCMDLTDIKQKEEMLWRSQKLDALGKISGGVAHDFNNMLGVILGYAQLLSNHISDNERLSRYAEQIVYAAERGAALTSKLLAFSRRRPSVHHNVNINQLIHNQLEVIGKALTANVNLVLDLESDVWTIKFEDAAFDDVLLNMAINAMHAMDGQGTLGITTRNISFNNVQSTELELEAGDYVCLTISDDGCGMDEDVKAQIFDPFFTTKGNDGTGFGLSQVYGFVRSAKGVIKVESKVGEGSSFSLYFPRQLIRLGETIVDDSKAQLFISGEESILVVDDEPSLCLLASNIISKYGYTVYTANSAEQALKILEQHPIDLLISDIIMPHTNGYQLVTLARKEYLDIRCLLVSGFIGEQEQIDESLCSDIVLITKPYTSYSLMRAIRNELNLGILAKCQMHEVIPWQNHPAMNEQFDLVLNKALLLIDRANSSNEVGKVGLKEQFVELGQIFNKHFEFEEAQMSKWDYPYVNEHIKAHRHLNALLDVNVQDMEVKQFVELLEQFLRYWIVEHVMLMDKAVVPFADKYAE